MATKKPRYAIAGGARPGGYGFASKPKAPPRPKAKPKGK